MNKQVVVIGGGAAGLIAAGVAGRQGNSVILLEKNNILGKKLRITGKGRCNITNIADMDELIDNIPGNGKFMFSSLKRFSNNDICQFFEQNGLKLKTERGGRVFPESDLAKDVVDSLIRFVKNSNVRIMTDSEVKKIVEENGCVKGVMLSDKKFIPAQSIIVATGGLSYPLTGSTGDGYKFAKEMNHNVTKLSPSLVPLIVEEKWVSNLMGLSLKNVEVKFTSPGGKKIYQEFGEMLFTHFGLSGPIILSASRHLLDFDYKAVVEIDMKPALSHEKLEERIMRDFSKNQRKQFKNSLGELLPQKLIPVIISLSKIPADKFVHQITKEERSRLVSLIKALSFKIVKARPIEEAIVTAGGVDIKQINPATLESKIVKGLFFTGEVLDVDAYTGGYNLTIAFSTGYNAGMNC